MPSSAATASATGPGIAGQHDDLDVLIVQLLHGGLRLRAHDIGHDEDGQRPTPRSPPKSWIRKMAACPRRAARFIAVRSTSETATERASSSAGPPMTSDRPSTRARTPTPGMAWKSVRRRRHDAALLGRPHDALGDGVLGVPFDRGGQP